VSVFRAETKATHPMIRLREISMFKEAHTAHADREDAERQVREAVEIYRRIFNWLCIPYVVSQRPEWDKFAGAVYTIAFDTVMPDGKALQIGTVHYLGTNFSRVFDVKYLRRDGKWDYVHTTSYGISERVIASLLAIHGDDKGLALPPNVAPIQVIIVPIAYRGSEETVRNEARKLREGLVNAGIRAEVDEREDKTPGWKYNYWEMMGVPLRVEIGPRDIEARQVVIARRDTLQKYAVPMDELVDAVMELMSEVTRNMSGEAWSRLRSSIRKAKSLEEAKIHLETGGIVEVPWSGESSCGLEIQEKLSASALGIPMEQEEEPRDLRDAACPDKKANYWLRIAKKY
jgi:prolyl-tRNA synthetase